MTNDDLKPGLEHSVTIEVDPTMTVPHLPRALPGMADMPSVFATAYMVAFVEATAIDAIKPYLTPDQRTVGTSVNMNHTAATPVGFKVTATVHLTAVEGKKLTFKVEARDEKEVIGQGTHERFIIDLPKFNARLEAKKSRG